jgi:cytochrome c oxidase subunit I+III
MTGRLLDERLGRWSFWVMFVGFNLAFFPMHVSGLLGMPRRVYTYQPGLGWDDLNLASTVGAFLFGLGILLFVANVLVSLGRGARAGANPWGASTLEWLMESPPPPYNVRRIPLIHSRDPLWDPESEGGGPTLDRGHRTLGTTVLDAEPDELLPMPAESGWPLALALALLTLCLGALLGRPLGTAALGLMALGALGACVAIAGWLWPDEPPQPPQEVRLA